MNDLKRKRATNENNRCNTQRERNSMLESSLQAEPLALDNCIPEFFNKYGSRTVIPKLEHVEACSSLGETAAIFTQALNSKLQSTGASSRNTVTTCDPTKYSA